jgi:hypothetical protein
MNLRMAISFRFPFGYRPFRGIRLAEMGYQPIDGQIGTIIKSRFREVLTFELVVTASHPPLRGFREGSGSAAPNRRR